MEILTLMARVVGPLLKWTVMRRDAELPWAVRIARWAAIAWIVGYVAHCYFEWFWR